MHTPLQRAATRAAQRFQVQHAQAAVFHLNGPVGRPAGQLRLVPGGGEDDHRHLTGRRPQVALLRQVAGRRQHHPGDAPEAFVGIEVVAVQCVVQQQGTGAAGQHHALLQQGDDLTVRDGHVWLKSLTGLLRVDVILRRVDDNYCDPLELREDSRLGVPGLLEVARRGNVAIAILHPRCANWHTGNCNSSNFRVLCQQAFDVFSRNVSLNNVSLNYCGVTGC